MQFWLAFFFGVIVLWLFAREQFNQPSWTYDGRLTRILSVPHLRGDKVRKRALLVYVMLLIIVYAVFVFLAGAIVIAAENGVGAAVQAGDASALALGLPSATVPLSVSLAMVGVAPRFELLTQIERKIREAAHELMGLPRALLSSGNAIAERPLSLDDIGCENFIAADLKRYVGHIEAAAAVFGREAVRVKRFERHLLKLIAYKVWIMDGVWPSLPTRAPYEALEAGLSVDLNACFADLDDIAAIPLEGLSMPERNALLKRWDDRLRATQELCGEICTLMFIYSEKEDPRLARPADPAQRSIAAFFERSSSGRSAAPELDIATLSLLAAGLIAGAWGYVGVALRPLYGLSPDNPGVGALLAAISALCIYGPPIFLAASRNSRLSGTALNIRGYLANFVIAAAVSLLLLVFLNLGQALVRGFLGADVLLRALLAAVLVEAPLAVLGAVQGIFVTLYFRIHRKSPDAEAVPRARLVAISVVTLVLASIVANHLIVAAYGQFGGSRAFTLADFVLRVPAAGLVALTIGLVMNTALFPRREGAGAHGQVAA